MKRKLKVVPKPNPHEYQKLNNYMWMADWHFTETIKPECTEIESENIYWKSDESTWEWAKVFGLQGIKTDSKEPCIANFFIRYRFKVYQVRTIKSVTELLQLLKKEAAYKEYQDKVWKQKFEERKKIEEIKKKAREKAKVKKLKVVAEKKVA